MKNGILKGKIWRLGVNDTYMHFILLKDRMAGAFWFNCILHHGKMGVLIIYFPQQIFNFLK